MYQKNCPSTPNCFTSTGCEKGMQDDGSCCKLERNTYKEITAIVKVRCITTAIKMPNHMDMILRSTDMLHMQTDMTILTNITAYLISDNDLSRDLIRANLHNNNCNTFILQIKLLRIFLRLAFKSV